MKKLWILASLICLLFAVPVFANKEETFTSGDYEYSLLEDGTVEITGYTGAATELEVPQEIDGIQVTVLEDGAFNRTGLTSVVIPESISKIGTAAFYGCASLTNIEIPESVTEIGERAFTRCSSLSSIDIPESVIEIGYGTFFECSSLTGINIPESVTEIGEVAFAFCSSLTNLEIPGTVKKIGEDAFAFCDNLTITVDQGSYAEQYCKENGLNYTYSEAG